MTTSTPTLTAHRMPGAVRTEDGFPVPQSAWFEFEQPWRTPYGIDVRHVAVTSTALLPCTSTGKLLHFPGRTLGQRHLGFTQAGELVRLGIEVTE